MPELNYLAILVAALASFGLGGLWYSPVLFGNAWMAASGFTEEQARQGNQAKIFGIAFVWALLGAAVFALFLGPAPGLWFGAGAGFAAGFFWITGAMAISYQFEHRPTKLLLINGGYHTVQYTMYGVILGVWG